MAYTKAWPEGWKDNEEGGTYINAAGLNHMEQGIIDAHDFQARKDNPHNVTKEQIGLGNVPNNATNDQTPTYTAASTLTALLSGEKLSAAFGKLAKAVSSLISHLADYGNPHKVTAAQAGAVPTTRTINGVALSSNVTLNAASVGAVPTTRTVNGKALSADITLTAEDVGAATAEDSNLPVTVSGNPVTFTTEGAYPLNPLTVHIEPVQSGSGDPSPDNVRPISGWDSLTVTRTGKNLADPDGFIVGGLGGSPNVNSQQNLLTGYIPVFPGRTYTKWWSLEMPAPGVVDVALFDRDKNYLRRVFANTFTTPSNCYFVRCEFQKTDGSAVTASELRTIQVQVEESAAFTGYSPYAAQTVTVSTGEAGTVYSGEFDVTTGELTATHKKVTLNGSEAWTKLATNGNFWGFSNKSAAYDGQNDVDNYTLPDYMCSMYTTITLTAQWRAATNNTSLIGIARHQASSSNATIIRDPRHADMTEEEFRAWLTEHPVELVYRLNNPVIYQLTPTQISALVGSNTVSANCGPVDVAYRPGAAAPVLTFADVGAAGGVPSWEQYVELRDAVIALGGNL